MTVGWLGNVLGDSLYRSNYNEMKWSYDKTVKNTMFYVYLGSGGDIVGHQETASQRPKIITRK